nr:hypothetical protein [Tanacetum cinerariifolium]
MDSIIPLGQKNTLAEYMILFGAENDLYHSWKSRIELYIKNREHGRMKLESVENDPLIWPTIEENGVTRTKKYVELSAAEKIQADCDMKATNIILQGFAVPVFSPGDDLIACLNKTMAFLTTVASSRVTVQQVQGKQGQSYSGTVIRVMLVVLRETMLMDRQGLLNTTTIKTEDLDTYDPDCDDISNAKAILMANISNYGSDVISEDFGKRFILQQELSTDEAFWYHMLNLSAKSSDALPVIKEAPKELSKVILLYPRIHQKHWTDPGDEGSVSRMFDSSGIDLNFKRLPIKTNLCSSLRSLKPKCIIESRAMRSSINLVKILFKFGNPVKEILLKLNLPDHRYTYRWTRRYLVLPDSQDLLPHAHT